MLYNFFRLVIYIPLVFVYIFNSAKLGVFIGVAKEKKARREEEQGE